MQAFVRELSIWAGLHHENILPLIGMAIFDGVPVLVSEWMENGNLVQFLSANINADRLEMVRIFAQSIGTRLTS